MIIELKEEGKRKEFFYLIGQRVTNDVVKHHICIFDRDKEEVHPFSLYFRDRFKEIENPEKLAMELEQERQETKKQPITENCMQSVKNIAVTRKASEVKKAIHEVKEEYAKIENLVQDNEEEKE